MFTAALLVMVNAYICIHAMNIVGKDFDLLIWYVLVLKKKPNRTMSDY